MTQTTIASAQLSATIDCRGAELVALSGDDGRALLWHGDARWWTGRAPLLFPIVGRLPDDTARLDGADYRLPQHGFARTSDFSLIAAEGDQCILDLTSNPALLALYPRMFALRLAYAIEGRTLAITAQVTNRDSRSMPFSFGFHPAFLWPLDPGVARADSAISFAAPEDNPIRRPLDGLLGDSEPSPVTAQRLELRDELFERGALVFDRLNSRSVIYGAANGKRLHIDFQGLPHLGIWTKPGAPFVCIEPWHGYAAPVGFSGELSDKPGIVNLAPSEMCRFDMRITIL